MPREKTQQSSGSSSNRRQIRTRGSASKKGASKEEISEWTVKSLSGQHPRLNCLNILVEDEKNQRVFDYGGISPGDRGDFPTADFHVCNFRTMEYKNLTKSLRFWDSASPFPQTTHNMPTRQLPSLGEAGAAFLRIENRNIMFLFGGYDKDEDQASSKLIAIDLDRLIWWIVQVKGKVEDGSIAARINPAMTAYGTKIYIFAGIAQYDEDPEHLKSYSIAAYDHESRTWRWEVADMAYPDNVPENQIFGNCVPVHDGKKILLTPGRRKPGDRFRFTENNMFLFHTTHKRFQTAYASGTFPGDVFWYYIHNFDCIATPDTHQKNSSRSLRGSSSRHPYRPSDNSALAFRNVSSQFTAPSVLICAWVAQPGTEYSTPDLWRFFLSPDEHITCLNIREKVWDLDLNLRRFVVVEERMVLMGSNVDSNNNSNNDSDDDDDDDSESDDRSDEEVFCNIYVDIPVRPLVLNSQP